MENLPLNILKNHDLLRFPNGICSWICVFSSLRYFRRSFKKSDFSALELPTRPSFSNSQPIQAYLLTHSFMALQWNWLGGRLTILRNRFIRVTKFHTNVPIRCPWFFPSPNHPPLTTHHPVYRQIFPWKFFSHLTSASTLRNESYNLKMHSFHSLWLGHQISLASEQASFRLASLFSLLFIFKFITEFLFRSSNIISLSLMIDFYPLLVDFLGFLFGFSFFFALAVL